MTSIRRLQAALPSNALTGVKVPEVTALFWLVKVLTTGMGEAASDFLAGQSVALAAGLGAVGLAIALWFQLRSDRYRPWIYWTAVAMVAVFGTMAADAVHVVLGVPYPVTTAAYALAVAACLLVWHRVEGTLSIHSISTRRRELFYWATVLATFALGTAAGDFTAMTLNLGYLESGILFAAAIAVPWALWRFGRLNEVAAFWAAYVLTRPLGASFADWVGKPAEKGSGLGLGDGPGHARAGRRHRRARRDARPFGRRAPGRGRLRRPGALRHGPRSLRGCAASGTGPSDRTVPRGAACRRGRTRRLRAPGSE